MLLCRLGTSQTLLVHCGTSGDELTYRYSKPCILSLYPWCRERDQVHSFDVCEFLHASKIPARSTAAQSAVRHGLWLTHFATPLVIKVRVRIG